MPCTLLWVKRWASCYRLHYNICCDTSFISMRFSTFSCTCPTYRFYCFDKAVYLQLGVRFSFSSAYIRRVTFALIVSNLRVFHIELLLFPLSVSLLIYFMIDFNAQVLTRREQQTVGSLLNRTNLKILNQQKLQTIRFEFSAEWIKIIKPNCNELLES